MPAAETEYRPYPLDGLPARVVGPWAMEKQHYLSRYMTIFANAMAKRWDAIAYLDLFAGPGVCVVEETDSFFDGSPLEALRHPFTDLIFVDLDSTALGALQTRAAPLTGGRNVTYLLGDCNAVIDAAIERIPDRALTLAFLDPTNWQVTFETVKRLTAGRPVDVLLTFHGGMLRRVRHIEEQPRVDAFFGTTSWRPLVESGEVGHLYDFCDCYRRQMQELGYEDRTGLFDPAIKNSKSGLLYHLLFFSRNERGHDFWGEVLKVSPSGQMNLFGGSAETSPRRMNRAKRR